MRVAISRARNALLAIMLCAGVAGAQEKTPPAQPAAPPAQPDSPGVLISPHEDYTIGAKDVLEIQVQDAAELSGKYPVGADGKFLMPYLGFITAQNRTPQELGRSIADSLRGKYLKDPRVSVTVSQYNSRAFFIWGAVRSPGVYRMEGKATLLKLVILAGGFADNHGSTAFIIREIKPGAAGQNPAQPAAMTGDQGNGLADSSQGEASAKGGAGEEYRLLKVNVNGLLKGYFDQNIPIEPGDVINIPPTDVFFVAGEVVAPGSFPLKEGTTLRQAVSLARGTTFEAAKGRGIIFRENTQTGKREEIAIDIGAVMAGKKDDVPIVANDIIMVPNSKFKSVSGTLLRAFGMNAAQRGLVF